MAGVGVVVAFVAGIITGRWVWLFWLPALRAYLHARWVRAVRAAVATLSPTERQILLGPPCSRLSHVEWDFREEEEVMTGGGQ